MERYLTWNQQANMKRLLPLLPPKPALRLIEQVCLPWFVLQRGLFRPSNMGMTGFRPDVAVVDGGELAAEPLWPEQSILTRGNSIKFVAEVVSNNWQNDYARKVEDYATLGISEYWIVDYAGLGGIRYIGKPKQPTVSICTLVDGEYEIKLLRDSQTIKSSIFPNLTLTAQQVLKAGNMTFQKALKESRNFFNSLLQKAFRGKL